MSSFDGKIYYADYAEDFHCIADRCRHSCCIGWEIDIDDASLSRFTSVTGPLGDKLRDFIYIPSEDSGEDDFCAHFILGQDERCPFLNEKNLCELILGLGEDSLCDICRDHPRFRNFYSDRIEIGLGLCCEEAARILLLRKQPVHLVSQDSEESSCTPVEQAFFTWRDGLFNIVFDPAHSLEEIFTKLSCAPFLGKKTGNVQGAPLLSAPGIQDLAGFLMTLERLDPSWGEILDSLRKPLTDPDVSVFKDYMRSSGRQTEYRMLLWYFLYRHLAGGLDEEYEDIAFEIDARVRFAISATRILFFLGAAHFHEHNTFTLEDQVELARMFSSEIEYSDENVGKILEYLY